MRKHYPFFDPSFLDIQEGKRPLEPEVREVSGIQIGVEETRRLLARQNNFLARYAEGPMREQQAAWLVAMAGCTANNHETPSLLARSMELGLDTSSIAELGLLTNSRQCALFLNSVGVNWKSLRVSATIDAEGSPHRNANEPSSALIDHLIDPDQAHRRKIRHDLVSVFQLAPSGIALAPVGFMEGVIESGQIQADDRIPSEALGLKDGEAFWFSHCIASGKFKMAHKCMQLMAPLPQEVLDEALLAVAMVGTHVYSLNEEPDIDRLVDFLRTQGANPDCAFDFSYSAMGYLTDKRGASDRSVSTLATAREWGVHSAIEARLSKSLDKAILRNPWPSPPEKATWLEYVLDRHAAMLCNSDEETVAHIIKKLMELKPAREFPDLIASISPSIIRHASSYEYPLLKALVASKQGKQAIGTIDAAVLGPLLCQWGGASIDKVASSNKGGNDKQGDTVEAISHSISHWWESPLISKIAQWMPASQCQTFLDRVAVLVKDMGGLEASANDPVSNNQAIELAYSTFVQDVSSPKPLSIARRRTL